MRVLLYKEELTGLNQVADLETGKIERSAEALRIILLYLSIHYLLAIGYWLIA